MFAPAPRLTTPTESLPTEADATGPASPEPVVAHSDYAHTDENASTSPEAGAASSSLIPAAETNTYRVVNPAATRLFMRAAYPPAMLSETLDEWLEITIAAYAWTVFQDLPTR